MKPWSLLIGLFLTGCGQRYIDCRDGENKVQAVRVEESCPEGTSRVQVCTMVPNSFGGFSPACEKAPPYFRGE